MLLTGPCFGYLFAGFGSGKGRTTNLPQMKKLSKHCFQSMPFITRSKRSFPLSPFCRRLSVRTSLTPKSTQGNILLFLPPPQILQGAPRSRLGPTPAPRGGSLARAPNAAGSPRPTLTRRGQGSAAPSASPLPPLPPLRPSRRPASRRAGAAPTAGRAGVAGRRGAWPGSGRTWPRGSAVWRGA